MAQQKIGDWCFQKKTTVCEIDPKILIIDSVPLQPHTSMFNGEGERKRVPEKNDRSCSLTLKRGVKGGNFQGGCSVRGCKANGRFLRKHQYTAIRNTGADEGQIIRSRITF